MNKRQALLIRVGIDSSYGKWNAPVNPEDGTFVYVPIPEEKKIMHGYETPYLPFIQACRSFGGNPPLHLKFDAHLDPDFEHLTYGDENQKGQQIKDLKEDDILAFYAGLKPIKPFSDRLYYALIGLFVVDKVLPAKEIKEEKDWNKNAHTRRIHHDKDYIVFAKEGGISGRLERCILIGERRDKAYRLKIDIIDAWGGIDFNNGYIQRSARIPRLNEPEKFYKWFQAQDVSLVQKNI